MSTQQLIKKIYKPSCAGLEHSEIQHCQSLYPQSRQLSTGKCGMYSWATRVHNTSLNKSQKSTGIEKNLAGQKLDHRGSRHSTDIQMEVTRYQDD